MQMTEEPERSTNGLSQMVVLPDGGTATLGAVGLLMDLVSKGYRVYTDGDDLMVGPSSRLSPRLLADVEKHRADLVALIHTEVTQ